MIMKKVGEKKKRKTLYLVTFTCARTGQKSDKEMDGSKQTTIRLKNKQTNLFF